jgi:hypothetical protein
MFLIIIINELALKEEEEPTSHFERMAAEPIQAVLLLLAMSRTPTVARQRCSVFLTIVVAGGLRGLVNIFFLPLR